MKLRKKHIQLVAANHAKFSIRGGTGLVFALAALFTGLIIAAIFVDPIGKLQEQAGASEAEAQLVVEQVLEQTGRPAIKFATDATPAQLDFWVTEKPTLITAFMLLFVLLLPFVVALGAFNQLSGDIGSRGIRYQLLRTERENLFLGRLIGTYLFSVVVYTALFVIVAIFFVAKVKFYTSGEMLAWLARGFFATAVYAMPYVALCAWISAAVDSPFGSLALSQLAIGTWPLIVMIGKGRWAPFENAGYVMPWAYRNWLFDPSMGKTLAAVAILVGFTVLFTVLGLRHFQRRDL